MNFTSYLIYERPKLSINQRKNYETEFEIKLKCTFCEEGYFLDKSADQCLEIKCGKNCEICIFEE